jgi:uncharacterized protein YehS (DUF1456 family)
VVGQPQGEVQHHKLRIGASGKIAMITVDSTNIGNLGRIKISGPAVDKLKARKENNNHKKMSDRQLRKNLETVSRSLVVSLKSLSSK